MAVLYYKNLNCNIIKIYPIKNKDSLINPSSYKHIDLIAAGGLSISDMDYYKKLGYRAIIIGDKGFKNQTFDPKIFQWLKNR